MCDSGEISESDLPITIPSKFFGATYWQGVYALLGDANPWMADIADNRIASAPAPGWGLPTWPDLLADYRLHPTPTMLDRVCADANAWIAKEVTPMRTGSSPDLGFYNLSYYPYSHGAIHFPCVRQQGYAWFTNRIYGSAPGSIFGDNNVHLWLDRKLAHVDSPAIDYVTARSLDKFWIVLMNESDQPENANVLLDREKVGILDKAAYTVVDSKGNATATGKGARRGLWLLAANRQQPSIASHMSSRLIPRRWISP